MRAAPVRDLGLSSFLVPGGEASACTATLPSRPETGGATDRLTYLSSYSSHLPGLSGAEQRALHLVEVEGASYCEVGQQLGIERDAVKKLVCNTRRKLHDHVEHMLGDLALLT